MGGRGSDGGRSGGGSFNQSKGERVYKRILNGEAISMTDFKEAKEYFKKNVSSEKILELAEHYKNIYDNRLDMDGFSGAQFKSYPVLNNSINLWSAEIFSNLFF